MANKVEKVEKVQQVGEMRFCFDDWQETKFNESVEATYALYGVEYDSAMSIETYYLLCRQFAAAMGFCEKTINEWFGEH